MAARLSSETLKILAEELRDRTLYKGKTSYGQRIYSVETENETLQLLIDERYPLGGINLLVMPDRYTVMRGYYDEGGDLVGESL